LTRQGAVYGSFSAPKAHEIVVSRGKGLDLLRPDEHGRVVRVAHAEIFGCVRSLATLRLPGTARDFLVVGSDSGRLAVLRFDKERACFEPVHRETFGRSGCRRGVPGQFLAADPKGRAVMVAAVEKQKLVYIMNRDSEAALTISSPLEAHKAHSLCLCLTALDCGFENPMFAAVELDFSEADADASGAAAAAAQRHLTYYELDLGLNHVVRRWSEPTDNAANMLIAVPGGGTGRAACWCAARTTSSTGTRNTQRCAQRSPGGPTSPLSAGFSSSRVPRTDRRACSSSWCKANTGTSTR